MEQVYGCTRSDIGIDRSQAESWVLGLKKERYKSDKKKRDLLHDIIFMADSRDAFMIIGVDEEDKYYIKDVRKDKGRGNTQNVVDSLKLKNYNKLLIINSLYQC